ncbi:MAG: TrgA family protein [Pseudomonadota bacterium]
MPTLAKVIAALLFAALAFYVSTIIQGMFVEERPLPALPYWNAFFGVICGWRIAGSRAGQGYHGAVGYGLTTTSALILMCLFFNCFAEMIRRSMRMQYDGPAEAVVAVMDLMVEFGQRVATQEVLITSFAGGLAAAFVVEAFGRRYS